VLQILLSVTVAKQKAAFARNDDDSNPSIFVAQMYVLVAGVRKVATKADLQRRIVRIS